MSPFANKIFSLLMAALFAIAPSAQAIGVSSPFGEVVVNNVPVGVEINLRDYAGVPYRVINTSLTSETVEILVMNGDPAQLRKGFEPIPDTSWVHLGRSEFELGPGGEGVTDLFITIPKDEKYLGKKFQVMLWARTKALAGGRLFGTGVQSRLLLQIASDMKTPAQAKRAAELTASLEFYFKPSEIKIADFPVGKSVPLKKEYSKSFKIVNFHDKAIKVSVRSLESTRSYAMLPPDHKVAPAEWLQLANPELLIEPDSIGEVGVAIRIPDKPENRGQKFFFIVEGVLLGYDVPLSAYGRIAVETAK